GRPAGGDPRRHPLRRRACRGDRDCRVRHDVRAAHGRCRLVYTGAQRVASEGHAGRAPARGDLAMPTHLEQMTERLPHLYREGELVQGLLALAATQMEIAEEEARAVQRSHWFDATLDLGEATRLALPLDIAREEWQTNLREYRAWVHAIRDALLRHGSVTVDALQRFVVQYASAYQVALGLRVLPQALVWGDRTAQQELVFEENPPLRRVHTLSGIEPLQRFSVTQNGLFETPAA